VENPCRLIAELADAVVFNVDYALAPEKKYPNGFEDCFGVVRHIFDHAEAYGVDKRKIAVGGDSAGGNLTAPWPRGIGMRKPGWWLCRY
jgi:acetyl esterase/lipase